MYREPCPCLVAAHIVHIFRMNPMGMPLALSVLKAAPKLLLCCCLLHSRTGSLKQSGSAEAAQDQHLGVCVHVHQHVHTCWHLLCFVKIDSHQWVLVQCQVCLWDTRRGVCVAAAQGHAGSVTALAFSRKAPGKWLASGAADKLLKVMPMPHVQPVRSPSICPLHAVEFS